MAQRCSFQRKQTQARRVAGNFAAKPRQQTQHSGTGKGHQRNIEKELKKKKKEKPPSPPPPPPLPSSSPSPPLLQPSPSSHWLNSHCNSNEIKVTAKKQSEKQTEKQTENCGIRTKASPATHSTQSHSCHPLPPCRPQPALSFPFQRFTPLYHCNDCGGCVMRRASLFLQQRLPSLFPFRYAPLLRSPFHLIPSSFSGASPRVFATVPFAMAETKEEVKEAPTLDRSAFRSQRQVVTLSIPAKSMQAVVRAVKPHMLKLKKISPVQEDPDRPGNKRILLSDKVTAAALPEPIPDLLAAHDITVGTAAVDVTYEAFTAEEALAKALPPHVTAPSAFETIGHIAHLNLREEQLPYKRIIGEVRQRLLWQYFAMAPTLRGSLGCRF